MNKEHKTSAERETGYYFKATYTSDEFPEYTGQEVLADDVDEQSYKILFQDGFEADMITDDDLSDYSDNFNRVSGWSEYWEKIRIQQPSEAGSSSFKKELYEMLSSVFYDGRTMSHGFHSYESAKESIEESGFDDFVSKYGSRAPHQNVLNEALEALEVVVICSNYDEVKTLPGITKNHWTNKIKSAIANLKKELKKRPAQ